MGHYADDYEKASADLVDYYGQPISYTDTSDGTIEITNAQVHPERGERRQNDFGWYLVQTRVVKFLTSEATDLGTTIESDGIIAIGEARYSIEAIKTLPGGRTQLDLTRASAGEIGRPDYRGRR